MKLFEYDRTGDNFDQYKRFSITRQMGFVEFMNGELTYNRRSPDPDERKMYERYGIQIASTGDTDLPKFTTLEGEEIPKAWLGYNGIQYMAIDHEKGVVVGTHNMLDRDRNQLPRNISNCSVYWASYLAMPIGGTLRYWKPAELTEQEHDYVAILKKLAKAMCALEGITYANGNTPMWTASQLRQFMATNPDPSAAMQALPVQVARQMIYAPTSWLERDKKVVRYLTWQGSNYQSK